MGGDWDYNGEDRMGGEGGIGSWERGEVGVG